MTLIELMAVVVIIGIFVALGFPAMGGILEDRYASQATDEIANLFRTARARSSATGAAHRVYVLASGSSGGLLELRTALTGAGGPTASCVSPSWTDVDSRLLTRIDVSSGAGTGPLSNHGISIDSLTGTSALEYCFTPGGIPWRRTGGGLWSRPLGSVETGWAVYRGTLAAPIGIVRRIRIMPSGLPSIVAN